MSDDKIAEIRKRHEAGPIGNLPIAAFSLADDDRATLLAEVERLRADLATQQGCCDGAAAQDAHIRREREEHRADVERQRAEIERLRADNERLRTVYVLIVSEEAGPVDSATCWYEDKIIGCYISREVAEGAAKLLMADWRISEYALEGKP